MHASDREHLEKCRDLPRPPRAHVHGAIEHVQRERASHDNDIPRDDQHRKPDREAKAPVAHAQRDDAREQQAFVRDRIEDYPESAALVVMPRDIAIDAIARSRDHENGRRAPALPLERRSCDYTLPVVDRHHHEQRDHQDPRESDLVRGGHGPGHAKGNARRKQSTAPSQADPVSSGSMLSWQKEARRFRCTHRFSP